MKYTLELAVNPYTKSCGEKTSDEAAQKSNPKCISLFSLVELVGGEGDFTLVFLFKFHGLQFLKTSLASHFD